MMKWALTQKKLKPFTTRAGQSFIVPLSQCQVCIYPTLLVLQHEDTEIKVHWEIDGFVRNFYAFLDLEKNMIEVQKMTDQGFIRYLLVCEGKSIILHLLKSPGQLSFSYSKNGNNERKSIDKKQKITLFEMERSFKVNPIEKLFLGCDKKQNWENIEKRKSLKEILPFWFSLGQQVPCNEYTNEGTAVLLENCHEAIIKKEKNKICDYLLKTFQIGFNDVMIPSLIDKNYYGICSCSENISKSSDPYSLLVRGKEVIRSLFFQQQGENFYILPAIPKEFVFGKMFNINCQGFGFLHMTWSKKQIQQMIFLPNKSFDMHLHLASNIRSFRMRSNKREIGKIVEKDQPVFIDESKKMYFFDRFRK